MSLRAERWKQIIVECNMSGIKKVDWLRMHGISEKSFYRWQTALRDEILKEMEQRQQCMPEQSNQSGGNHGQDPDSCFLDVAEMISRRNETFMPFQSIGQWIPELMLQAGPYNLYIGNHVTESTLATVLRVIGRA